MKKAKNRKTNMTKVDKNTSTSDGSNSRVNILSTNNRKNNKNSKKLTNKSTQKEQNVKNIKKEEVKDNLTLLKEKTKSLELNLTALRLYIDEERNNTINDTHNLNATIKDINNEISRLTVDNKYLTKCFNSLNKRLITEVNQAILKSIRNKNNNNNVNTEENLNKNIKLKEKMILNNKTNLQLIKNEIDYLEEEVEENEAPDRKEKLEKMLEELRTTQNKKKKEIEELKTMKTEHNKICTKRLRELLKP